MPSRGFRSRIMQMLSTTLKVTSSTEQQRTAFLVRSYFRAPMFWLTEAVAAWATESWAQKTKASMLAAALLPAMTMAPKEFTEDWMMTLEMEKRLP